MGCKNCRQAWERISAPLQEPVQHWYQHCAQAHHSTQARVDGLENGASEVRNHLIFLLSPLAVAAISFRTPALCVGTAVRGWRAWGEGTAWAQLQGSPAPPGVTPKMSLSKIPPSKITCKAQEWIQLFPPGSSTPLMAFPSMEGLFLAQAEVFVTKEKDTF